MTRSSLGRLLCIATFVAAASLGIAGCSGGCLGDSDCSGPPGSIPGVDCSPNGEYCDGNTAVVCDVSGKVANSRQTDCGSAKCMYSSETHQASCVPVRVAFPEAGPG